MPFDGIVGALPSHSLIITDDNVYPLWAQTFSDPLVIPAGESSKCLRQFGELIEKCAERGADRKTTLVALGGGVIGDLVGYVASSYMRGVPYIQVPTTLLAQVDSSVGGKVAIDMPQGKNIVGAFYPPEAVYISTETLTTLSERQFRNGSAEVIKYGLILDIDLASLLFDCPMTTIDERTNDIVSRCVRIKRDVVAQDEFDRNGLRASLNFGHTIAHAIEQVTGYGPVLHGEAVGIGMFFEAILGEMLGLTEPGTAKWVREYIRRHRLNTEHPSIEQTDDLIRAMRRDKKNESDGIAFSLITRVGESKLVTGVDEATIRSLLTKEWKRYVTA
jgi:3-dehydroquinate synthase